MTGPNPGAAPSDLALGRRRRALQIMLDKGKELDWFESSRIITLAVVAVVGFLLFQRQFVQSFMRAGVK